MTFAKVFDNMYGMTAVRFYDKSCGIVDGNGNVLWKTGMCQTMKFIKGHILTARHDDGSDAYIDLHNFMIYDKKPMVKRYGNIEMLRVDRTYYSRTKKVYISNRNITCKDICHKDFYLMISDNCMPAPYCGGEQQSGITTQGYVCLLEGDNDSFYRINRRLADGSIIIADNNRNYYHAAKGKKKRLIGRDDKQQEWDECRKGIERLTLMIKEKCRKQEEDRERRKKQELDNIKDVQPFKAGMKWGLKTGNRIIVPPVYRNVKQPVGRFCAVEANYCRWGVITLDGAMVIKPQYPDVEIKEGGTAVLTLVTGTKEVVNISGA